VSEPNTPHEHSASRENPGTLSRQPDRLTLLAHQLVTPLATISSLAQGLMRRTGRMSAHDVEERAEKIWRASLRLQELIEMIMSYTRVNAGAITPKLNVFNLEDVLRRVCQEQGKQEPERLFDLDLKDMPASFLGDPILLEQVFVIVLSNALKYSQPHQSIKITGRRRNNKITIIVKDQGIGVPKSDLPYLMQPFFRGRNAKHMPGTGLGLSLVWHILKLHGGNVQIESKEGRGTAVTISLLDEPSSGSGGDI
jgi:two-component system, OmpR family, sensor histidine kinase SenX3